MVYYLKLNSMQDYAINNLQNWITVITLTEEPLVFILCDNEKLIERIKCEVDFKGINPQYINSVKDKKCKQVISLITTPRWNNAGYAHMTTFIHSKENNYLEFWNIDADDTLICLEPKRTKQLLEYAYKYAISNNIDLFSLDMWRSRSNGMHWSFGITYVNNVPNWYDLIMKYKDIKENSVYFTNRRRPKNIDEFFTYIKSKENSVKMETFYVENLTFVHYSDDFIMKPITSNVCHWKNGKCIYPIIKYVYCVDSMGEIPIYSDIIKLEMDINDMECGFFISTIAPYSMESANIVESREYLRYSKKIIKKQIDCNLKSLELPKGNSKIFIFGEGVFTNLLIEELNRRFIEIIGIIDNSKNKWGKITGNILVYPPSKLLEYNISQIIVLIDVKYYSDIKKQLLSIGILEKNIIKIIDFQKINY